MALNILMITDLQQLLMNHTVQYVFDIIYLLLPVLLTYSFVYRKRYSRILAAATALFSIIYNLFFSAMSVISIEVFVSWMIIPLIFYARTVKGFYYGMHMVRIIFAMMMFSAALWKLKTGALFNPEQMPAILIQQHSAYLASGTDTFFYRLISYLINHQSLSQLFYVAGFIAELIFIIAFFTKRFDRWLVVSLILFLLFDYLLMEINYFGWLPFAACFWFSKYKEE